MLIKEFYNSPAIHISSQCSIVSHSYEEFKCKCDFPMYVIYYNYLIINGNLLSFTQKLKSLYRYLFLCPLTHIYYELLVLVSYMTRKFHKSFKTLPCLCYMKIKHLALGLDTNKALGFASCLRITISAVCLVLYFSYSTRGNALTLLYKKVNKQV